MKLSALICGHFFLLMLNVWLAMVGEAQGLTTTKYYISQRQLKNRLDEIKKTRDPIRTSNSNVYYIDEAAESQEYADIGGAAPEMGGYGGEKGFVDTPMMMMMEKKSSKFLSEEVIFVIVIVGLALFLCFLSSLIVPIALFIISGGFMSPLGLGMGGMGGMGGLGMGAGMMGRRRRRRSLPPESLQQSYQQFEKALHKFSTL